MAIMSFVGALLLLKIQSNTDMSYRENPRPAEGRRAGGSSQSNQVSIGAAQAL
jgi:hypothetical protein